MKDQLHVKWHYCAHLDNKFLYFCHEAGDVFNTGDYTVSKNIGAL